MGSYDCKEGMIIIIIIKGFEKEEWLWSAIKFYMMQMICSLLVYLSKSKTYKHAALIKTNYITEH